MSSPDHSLGRVRPVRLLHFADLHLGVQSGGRLDPGTGLNQRVVDVCRRFDELCDAAEADQVDAVLFAGDAFNNQHPNPTLQSLFAERIRRLARSGIGVFLLIGNHDLPRMASLAHPFSIYDALEVEGVAVGDRAKVYRLPLRDGLGDLQVAALPHFSRHQALARIGSDVADPEAHIAELVTRTVRDLGSQIDPQLPAVFIGHCHVNQADVGSAHSLFGVSDVEVSLSTLVATDAFPYYGLGHIHKRQVLNDAPFVAYPGSLERIDFGEGDKVDVGGNGALSQRAAEAKGFYRVDLVRDDSSWTLAAPPEFREVAARRFITLDLDTLDEQAPMDDIDRRIRAALDGGIDVGEAFVRVTATLPSADRGRINVAALRAMLDGAYDVSIALDTSSAALVRDPRFARRMSETDALDNFLESRDDWADDRAELARIGRELIAEVTRG
jgi:exonuclease SbcD